MTYEEFKTSVVERVKSIFEDAKSVEVTTIIKNNDTFLDGLVIREENINVTPTIYLNYYFNKYQEGEDFEYVIDDIIDCYMEYKADHSIDLSFYLDYEKAKDNIVFKLINKESNKQLLADVPYIEYLDLAIVFYCYGEIDSLCEDKGGVILIKNDQMKNWGITKEELYATAMVNTPNILAPNTETMEAIMKKIMNETALDRLYTNGFPSNPMYVVSNSNKTNGAGVILYPDFLKDMAHRLNSNLYIIPSSIHETIIIPDFTLRRPGMEQDMNAMVSQVNETSLDRQDVLSDHLYYYSRDCQRLKAI